MSLLKSNTKTAIITGSSGGVGSHIALSLAKAGYNIVIHFFKSEKEARLLEKDISKITEYMIIGGDVSKYKDAFNIIKKTVNRFGTVDVLINNAGIHKDSTVSKMDSKTWNDVISVNLGGVFNMSKVVLPVMKRQKYGRIINISSVVAFRGIAGASNYAASKAGIDGFSKSLSKEVARYNITVNVIAPGYFETGMFHDLGPDYRNKIVQSIPVKRLGDPNEISELLQIIISSGYMTGQTFILDGGYSV